MLRAYYSKSVSNFLLDTKESILGEFTERHQFALEPLQRNAWITQIEILKDQLQSITEGHILFEYSIPRMGKRVDVILLLNGLVYVIEFKVGEDTYSSYAIDQVTDYCLDLKNFHSESHYKSLIPILVATDAPDIKNKIVIDEDLIYKPLKANKSNLLDTISCDNIASESTVINASEWENSIYKPTPTIIEAAQALYQGHNVNEISRSDSGAYNLEETYNYISDIIEDSKRRNVKSICFITGVPGSGKTLAGLNIANRRHNVDENEHAVFLSGNGPLVEVLQEALARDETSKNGTSKSAALMKTKAFIQNIHHFRDDVLEPDKPPIEKVAIFDEAQRAWTLKQISSFMETQKGISDFSMSEPEFLISAMDRHEGWAVIVCLIGGGQEINTGEAGLPEWFKSLKERYTNWNVHVSDQLLDYEYTMGEELFSGFESSKFYKNSKLHLATSIRSFRSENVSLFVKYLLDNNVNDAKHLYLMLKDKYPILMTRDIDQAKEWLKKKKRGTERIGLVAYSKGKRLRPYGIHVKSKIEPKHWFLNDKNDIRSSFYLEEVATEFDIQGLELDWVCMAWDSSFRIEENEWCYKSFKGTRWQNINDETRKLYLKNSYRVLLTRARQGMIVFIPNGDELDHTNLPEFHENTYQYLLNIGINEI